MSSVSKFLLWIAFGGLLIYGGYYAYTNWWEEGVREGAVGSVKGVAVEVVENTKEKISEAQKSVGENIGSFIKDKTGSVISSFGDVISDFGRSIVGEEQRVPVQSGSSVGFDSFSGGVATTSAQTDSNFILPPPFTAIIVKTGVPLAFSINRNVDYAIDWADGTFESGTVNEKESVLISHEWKRHGDYSVEFKIKDGGEIRTYVFPVRVYETL